MTFSPEKSFLKIIYFVVSIQNLTVENIYKKLVLKKNRQRFQTFLQTMITSSPLFGSCEFVSQTNFAVSFQIQKAH